MRLSHNVLRRPISLGRSIEFPALVFATLLVLVGAAPREALASGPEPFANRRVPSNGVQASAANKERRTVNPPPQHTEKKVARANGEREKSAVARAAHDQMVTPARGEVFPATSGLVTAGVVEAACGFEHHAGIEMGCGLEPGCGLESGLSHDHEAICGLEAACGVEPHHGWSPQCAHCSGPAPCDSCDSLVGCDASYGAPVFLPFLRIDWSQFEFFGGVHSFSGPANFAGAGTAIARDGTGSFGLQEGFNYAAPSYILGRTLSWQMGLRASQTNASGAEFTDESRSQLFFTGGLFRRVDYGFQGGVVADYLYDDWYTSLGLVQLRAQLSWMLDPRHEFGYGLMANVGGDEGSGTIINNAGDSVPVQLAMEPLDQHRFFYRYYFRKTGSLELFAGFSEQSDGLLGMSTEVPLLDGLGLRTGFVYLNPDVSGTEVDNQEESWNLGLSFVWYPCGSLARSRYDRPLFEVADNGTLLQTRQ